MPDARTHAEPTRCATKGCRAWTFARYCDDHATHTPAAVTDATLRGAGVVTPPPRVLASRRKRVRALSLSETMDAVIDHRTLDRQATRRQARGYTMYLASDPDARRWIPGEARSADKGTPRTRATVAPTTHRTTAADLPSIRAGEQY